MSPVGQYPGQAHWPKYMANERAWVRAILCRLTADQRRRYEIEMEQTPSGYRNGKKYDKMKARIAERIMYEDARLSPAPPEESPKP